MKLNEARQMAESLMAEHGLRGWRFEWYPYADEAGYAGHGVFELGKPQTKARYKEAVRDTVLHEIAHALHQDSVGGLDNIPWGTGHGPEWQRIAASLGACTDYVKDPDGDGADMWSVCEDLSCPRGQENARATADWEAIRTRAFEIVAENEQ